MTAEWLRQQIDELKEQIREMEYEQSIAGEDFRAESITTKQMLIGAWEDELRKIEVTNA